MLTTQEIRNYQLFKGLNEAELGEMAGLCGRRTYEMNSVIFDSDTPSEDLFLVESGNDAIQIELPLGVQQGKIVIHTLSKGETFGWACLCPQHLKTATARCLERVTLVTLNGRQLLQLLEKNPHMGFMVMKNLSDNINMRLAYTTVAFRHELRKARVAV
jgi:CRP/FNR family transcriptional regulator, cyclic AMP receptor protein